jgi:3-deoxy-D-manno-octulosonic-acid transferase
VLTPYAYLRLRARLANGKEQRARLRERWGIPLFSRPAGKILWCHGASVGESLSALPLLRQFLEQHPRWHVLMTTGTVTSATLLAERLPERAFHQYIPLDHPAWVARFQRHWRPDAVVWLESELWPNHLRALRERRVPALLVNARMAEASVQRWQRFPRSVRVMLSTFQRILAQDETQASRYRALGHGVVDNSGVLKADVPPLAVSETALCALNAALQQRPLWLAASTHEGEEAACLRVHQWLQADFPNLLTILAPRHPERGEDLRLLVESHGLRLEQRSRQEAISPETQVYLADTMGELGTFYALSPIVFVGGSLVPHGGQNMLEPAQAGAAILYGRHTFNFTPVVEHFAHCGAATVVEDAHQLSVAVHSFLTTPTLAREQGRKARQAVQGLHGALAKTLEILTKLVHP